MRTIDVRERRARLARRHLLAPEGGGASVEAATEALVGLHATDPSTVYLSARARVPGFTVADLDRALYDDRTVVRHLAMRRTLFVVPVGLLPLVQGGVSARVADSEGRRLAREVEKSGLVPDGARWLEQASAAVLDALAGGRQASSTELRRQIPLLEGSITYGEGRSWGGEVPVGPRVLTVLSAAGEIVRAGNDGRWTVSRPRWATFAGWLGEPLHPEPPRESLAALVEVWLRRFGPATLQDVRWWFGATLTATRRALADSGAVEVDLEGRAGYVAADDLDPEPPVEPWAALLPGLDPTTMGWADRDWYLGGHREHVFDGNGNGGPTAWWDGRIVGGWHQDEGGAVVLDLLEQVPSRALRRLRAEADLLTGWLEGTRVTARFPSPLLRRSAAPGPGGR